MSHRLRLLIVLLAVVLTAGVFAPFVMAQDNGISKPTWMCQGAGYSDEGNGVYTVTLSAHGQWFRIVDANGGVVGQPQQSTVFSHIHLSPGWYQGQAADDQSGPWTHDNCGFNIPESTYTPTPSPTPTNTPTNTLTPSPTPTETATPDDSWTYVVVPNCVPPTFHIDVAGPTVVRVTGQIDGTLDVAKTANITVYFKDGTKVNADIPIPALSDVDCGTTATPTSSPTPPPCGEACQHDWCPVSNSIANWPEGTVGGIVEIPGGSFVVEGGAIKISWIPIDYVGQITLIPSNFNGQPTQLVVNVKDMRDSKIENRCDNVKTDTTPVPTLPPVVTATPVPFSAARSAVSLAVDCTGAITLDRGDFAFVRYEFQTIDGEWHLYVEGTPFPSTAVGFRAILRGTEGTFPVPTILPTNCGQPTKVGPSMWVGAGLNGDPGVVISTQGHSVQSVWLEADGVRTQLTAWANDLNQCAGKVMAQFNYRVGHPTTVIAYLSENVVLRQQVREDYAGSDVNCSNLKLVDGKWHGFWYGGNTYQSWMRFLGFTGTYKQIADAFKALRPNHEFEFTLTPALTANLSQ